MGDRIRTAVLVVVTVVWALNFFASVFIPSFQPSPEINTIFMGTVGVLLAATPKRGRREVDRRRDEEPRRTRRNHESR